jgi:hypothetical protein
MKKDEDALIWVGGKNIVQAGFVSQLKQLANSLTVRGLKL